MGMGLMQASDLYEGGSLKFCSAWLLRNLNLFVPVAIYARSMCVTGIED